MSRTFRSKSKMIEYLGAREVSVPCTTAETHSAPKRAFQYGTAYREQTIQRWAALTHNSVQSTHHRLLSDRGRKEVRSQRTVAKKSLGAL